MQDIKRDRKRRLLAILTLILFILLLIFPQSTKKWVLSAITMYAKTVLPSLLPFMLLSRIYLSLEEKQSPAVLFFISALSGFPMGAVIFGEFCEKRNIDKKKASLYISAANLTSPAFSIGVIGLSLFSSATLGWTVYACSLISSLILLFLFSLFLNKGNNSKEDICKKDSRPISVIFTDSASEAAKGALVLSVYIVFFSLISHIASFLMLSPTVSALTAGILEISGGIDFLKSVAGTKKLLLAGFFCGFGGVSVAMQAKAVSKELSLSVYFLFKLLCGILTSVLLYFTADFFLFMP